MGVSRALERLIKLRRLDRPATNDGDEWAAVDEPNATNEPTAVEENVTNEPTAIEENATNEPTAVEENVTNEPTAIEENATNEPTAVGENATNEPTAASQWLLVTSGNPRAVATKVGQAFQPDVRYVRLESLT